MRFVPLAAVFAALIAVLLPAPASAITNGTPDGETHPAVGAMVNAKAYADGTWSYCTGTLISPTVFLTAAHCGENGQKTALVSFSSHYQLGSGVYVGRYVADPDYTEKSDLHDIAVVVFSTPIAGIKPARLPTAGLLDRLEANGTLGKSVFTPVGYGSALPTGDGKTYHYSDTRRLTSISFGSLTRSWLKLSMDGKKDGSTCFGDSGGPNFLGGPTSDLVVATTISGDDDACRMTNLDYRLDTPTARAFLGKYVTLP
ncbi:S1 family peptidase [Actinoallomurus iriomotensis]|uniref:Serine protease n=1 Tax=Actinoallomurus iriomotensis TaxID=478107 RepID=A0A9W6RD45_9ACTN|nr:trypsin-like serine protease [Actinoallomurus iriomotensis]GLY71740.1 serine protease [Actinoallomurus iriomotensis]